MTQEHDDTNGRIKRANGVIGDVDGADANLEAKLKTRENGWWHSSRINSDDFDATLTAYQVRQGVLIRAERRDGPKYGVADITIPDDTFVKLAVHIVNNTHGVMIAECDLDQLDDGSHVPAETPEDADVMEGELYYSPIAGGDAQ